MVNYTSSYINIWKELEIKTGEELSRLFNYLEVPNKRSIEMLLSNLDVEVTSFLNSSNKFNKQQNLINIENWSDTLIEITINSDIQIRVLITKIINKALAIMIKSTLGDSNED